MSETQPTPQRSEFKAEIQQVLDILVHSLYTEKEIFLRELISNASDALNRFKLESLKSQAVLNPAAELGIWLESDPKTRTLTVRDTGVGLSAEEMQTYLGTIAHSGAKRFIETMKELNGGDTQTTRDVIGQFGVGFYSVFMVADEVTVTSRSYDPGSTAAYWRSDGQGSYEVGPADTAERGTTVHIKLKDDAKEFAESYRLRQIVKEHSDFVAFPVYLKEDGDWKQVNARTALWRESPRDVEADRYKTFYQQLEARLPGLRRGLRLGRPPQVAPGGQGRGDGQGAAGAVPGSPGKDGGPSLCLSVGGSCHQDGRIIGRRVSRRFFHDIRLPIDFHLITYARQGLQFNGPNGRVVSGES